MSITCAHCGASARLLHTGEGRVLVALAPREIVELVASTVDADLRARLITALALVDPDSAAALA